MLRAICVCLNMSAITSHIYEGISKREKRKTIKSSLKLIRNNLYGRNSYQMKSSWNKDIRSQQYEYLLYLAFIVISFRHFIQAKDNQPIRRTNFFEFSIPSFCFFVLRINSFFSTLWIATELFVWQFGLQPEFPHRSNYQTYSW